MQNLNLLLANNRMKVAAPPVLVELYRGSIVESVHRAYVCVCNSRGEVVSSFGDPDYTAYMRSSAKPLQAISLITSGAADEYNLSYRHLAIASGSHSGENMHIKAVSEMLNAAGLNTGFLKCGSHQPFDKMSRNSLKSRGETPQPIHHNCSGKHAGMLLCAAFGNHDLENYLDIDHPIQKSIARIIAETAGVEPNEIEVALDGCSAPVHALTMKNAAVAFANLIDSSGMREELHNAADLITKSMRRYPEMIAGRNERICTKLIENGSDFCLIAKAGAEGYYAAAWLDRQSGEGRGMTVKVEDGMQRARDPLVIALLQRYGVLPEDLPKSLIPFAAGPVTNHAGLRVGSVVVNLEN